MSRQDQWLFETPLTEASNHHANLEYETPLEQKWEISADNYYNAPLTEEEWEMSSTRRPLRRTGGIPRRNSRQATPSQHRRGQSKQLHRPNLSRQATGLEARTIRIATIDRFEFGGYLLKKPQFEKLSDLIFLLEDSQELSTLYLHFRGHTDNIGGNSYSNDLLAIRRAMEVESLIRRIYQQLPSSKLSYAEPDEPIAPNTTEDGRARNRRVEVFSIIPEPIGANSSGRLAATQLKS